MGKKNKKIKATVSVLLMSTIFISAIPEIAYGKVTGVIVKDENGRYIKYNYEKLKRHELRNVVQKKSDYIDDFYKMEIMGYEDDKTGYVKKDVVNKAAEKSIRNGKRFDIHKFTESIVKNEEKITNIKTENVINAEFIWVEKFVSTLEVKVNSENLKDKKYIKEMEQLLKQARKKINRVGDKKLKDSLSKRIMLIEETIDKAKKAVNYDEELKLVISDSDIKVQRDGVIINGKVSQDTRVTIKIMNSQGNFIYFDQLDTNKLGGTGVLNKFIPMEDQKNDKYVITIGASKEDQKIKKEFKVTYENLVAIDKINTANSPRDLQVLIDEYYEKIDLNLIAYDELTDESRLDVANTLLKIKEKNKFNNSKEFAQVFAEVVSKVNENKQSLENNAKLAVEKVEKSLEKADYESAMALVNVLKDGAIKQELTSRLLKVKEKIDGEQSQEAIKQQAYAAVEKVENSLWKIDYENAIALLNTLKDEEIKKQLSSRLVKVKEKIDEEEKQESIKKEAYSAVSKAESDKNEENYKAAKELVDKLKEGQEKNALVDRLKKVRDYIDASKSKDEFGFKVLNVYGSNGVAKVKVQLVFKNSGIAIADELKSYSLKVTSHEVEKIEFDGRYFMIYVKQEDLFKRDRTLAEKSIKMEITKKDTSKRIVPNDNLDKDYHLGAYYKFIKPNELATSLDGSTLTFKSPSCNKEGIVKVELTQSGSLQLRPEALGETTISVNVLDTKGNEITVSFKVVISKPAPKIKEKLQQDKDFVVTYEKDGQPKTIAFNPGVFEEEGYEVRLYEWDDKNNNNVLNVDKGELGKYIVLDKKTIKDKDGNIILPDSDISTLDIKKYKFIVSVVDLSNGKESRVSQDFGITIKAK